MTTDPTHNKLPSIKMSVRRLAELIHRDGGLASANSGSISGLEGIRAQQKTIAAMQEDPRFFGAEFQPEFPLSDRIEVAQGTMELSGRADLLLRQGNQAIIYEFKSYRGSKLKLSREGQAAHWAQALLYTALLARDSAFAQPAYETRLVYTSVDTLDYEVLTRQSTTQELAEFLASTVQRYLLRTADLILWRGRRDASLKAARFPYPGLRAGQLEMMQEVLAGLRDTRTLFVEAPTGIGKTLSVLYPALKALSAGFVDRIFYATAMISTRDQAENALRLLRENSGCLIRSIRLRAKEKLCLQPDLYCDQQLCPYAVHYYDHLPDALNELLRFEEINGDILSNLAQKYQVCPFELSLDVAYFCDVIIGDYNHVFDPRIKLQRFFDRDDSGTTAILVDEAHNVATRSRSMYSAAINSDEIATLLALWKNPEYRSFAASYLSLKIALETVLQALKSCQACFTPENFKEAIRTGRYDLTRNPLSQNHNPDDWVRAGNFLAIRGKPDRFTQELSRLVKELRIFFDEQRDFPGRRQFLEVFFDLLHFENMVNIYFNSSYITACRQVKSSLYLSILCLDASNFISEIYYDRHPVVFFSATLYPQDYYEHLLYSHSQEDPPERLRLPSPFPKEKRLLLVDSSVSLRYQDRQDSLARVLQLIYTACAQKTGNYLVFAPSYAYIEDLIRYVKAYPRPENTDIIRQKTGMSESAKQAFLKRFNQYRDKSLIAFAVMGGTFSEGIDLVGEKLSGVICISVGLPGLSPERQLLAEYNEEKFSSGFLYAYVFPGFQKVRQAAGRLIRSENDRGFILLIDSRWHEPPYAQLFPPENPPHYLEGLEDLRLTLQDFWQKPGQV